MDEKIKNALIYGFLAAVGAMFLYTSSISEVPSAPWIGTLLFRYGLAVAVFLALEYVNPSDEYNEYQGVVTVIVLLVLVGISIMYFGVDILKIVGVTALSVALGRALILMIGLIGLVIDLLSSVL